MRCWLGGDGGGGDERQIVGGYREGSKYTDVVPRVFSVACVYLDLP